MQGKIYVVGIGPGKKEHMSLRAVEAIETADVIVGYKTYIDILKKYFDLKNTVSSGMKKETDRCREALKLAESGSRVALVSSGDPGVYGMAGLMLEIASENGGGIRVEVIPGITSSSASASVLGAPLMHDFASISLSDLLTEWELIKERVMHAAQADFVICLYNPKSKTRISNIEEAREIILKYRDKNTPVGIVTDALREEQSYVITTLENILEHDINMRTTIVVGNSATYVLNNRMITPRGYVL